MANGLNGHETVTEAEVTLASKRRTSFSGDVARLTSGTVFAQGLLVLASPFLTRLYSPGSFGILALFTAITSIVIVVSCMRYELAIVLPKSDKEAANLLAVSLLFALIVSIITVPAVWWGRDILLKWLNAPQLSPYLWLIPPAVLLGGVYLALNYWNSRTRHFARLSIARVTSSATTVSAQLAAGYVGAASGGSLIGGHMAGQAVSTSVLGGQVWRDDRHILFRSVCWQDMFLELKRHRKFPKYSTGAAIMNTMSLQVPILLLSIFFSPIVVGFYSLGHRILKMPATLVGHAIAQVFYQRASTAKHDGALPDVVEKIFRQLVILGLLPFLMIMFIGADIFSVVFGQNWSEAGVYAQILAPWVFVTFIGSPISTISSVLEKQEIGLFYNVVLITSRVISLVIGGVSGNIILSLCLFSFTGICLCGWLYGYLIYISKAKIAYIVKMFLKQLFVCVIFILPVFFVKYVLFGSSLAIMITGGCVAIAYYVNHAVRDDATRAMMRSILTKRR